MKSTSHSVMFYCNKCGKDLYVSDSETVTEGEDKVFPCRATPMDMVDRLIDEGHTYCTFCDIHYKVMRYPNVLPLTLYPV